MKSIKQIMEEFLSEQKERLKPGTYKVSIPVTLNTHPEKV